MGIRTRHTLPAKMQTINLLLPPLASRLRLERGCPHNQRKIDLPHEICLQGPCTYLFLTIKLQAKAPEQFISYITKKTEPICRRNYLIEKGTLSFLSRCQFVTQTLFALRCIALADSYIFKKLFGYFSILLMYFAGTFRC